MESFKYVSLFSGIGGFDLALNRLGGECVLASEIDPWANKSFKYLYGFETSGDVTKVKEEDVPPHNVMVAGFPCQSFSISGRRLGLKDTRGTLFFEVARIVKEKQPEVVFLENVKGLLSDDNGKTLHVILKTLNEAGYLVDFKVINSSEHGVAQSRERIYILGVREDLEEQRGWVIRGNTVEGINKRRLMLDKELRTFNFKILKNTRKRCRIEDILESGEVDERYFVKEEKLDILMETLKEKGFGNEEQVRKKRPRSLFSREDLKGKRYDLTKVGYIDPDGYDTHNRVYTVKGLAPTITASSGGETHILVEKDGEQRVRRLTPLECLRLQAFPDEYYNILSEKGISNTQIYKQAGNAVTVNVIEDLMKSILSMGYIKAKGKKGVG